MLNPSHAIRIALAMLLLVAMAAPAKAESLQAVIAGVRGLVQVRQAEDQPWQPAAVGMKLDQGSEFRTGPRSAVQVKIEPGQTITLDRLGTMKLLQAVRQEGKMVTDLGMKYGRTRYDIQTEGVEHESTIHSPSATLAVRGTRVGVQDGPLFGFLAWSTQNTGRVRDKLLRRSMTIQGGQSVDGNSDSPGDKARNDGTVDPRNGNERDGDEADLVVTYPVGTFDQSNGGSMEEFRQQMAGSDGDHRHPLDPGDVITEPVDQPLAMVLSWQVPDTTGIFADLDFRIFAPGFGDEPFQTKTNNAQNGTIHGSGGIVAQDHVAFGGDGNPSGEEVAAWSPTYPSGLWQVGVLYDSGNASVVPWSIDIFQNGSLLDTLTGTVSPLQSDSQSVIIENPNGLN